MSADPSFYRRRPLRRFLRNWLERHRHPFNRGIHLIGIPLAFAGVAMFFTSPWPWALAAFVAGYVLQWFGHRVDSNDVTALPAPCGPFIRLVRLGGQSASGVDR